MYSDDRRYMSYEERAIDDPRYRGKVASKPQRASFCYCGKSVYRDAKGSKVSDKCPRNCEANRP